MRLVCRVHPLRKDRRRANAQGGPAPLAAGALGHDQGFVSKVLQAIAQQQKEGWLLPDDAGRIYEQAENSDVLK